MVIFAGVVLGVEAASLTPPPGFELGKGAILGAFLVSAAFLAGASIMRRSAAAVCGMLLLAAGGVIQAIWLGVVNAPPPTIMMLIEGVFAASALIFLSSTISVASRSQLVGGLLFAGALSMVGIGVINAVLGGEASGLLKMGLAAVAAVSVGLAAFAGARGDSAARLIFPGAVLTALAPLMFGAVGSSGLFALAPHALFAIGLLTAGVVVLADFGRSAPSAVFSADAAASFSGRPAPMDHRAEYSRDRALRVSENQLAQVLDYSGIAVLDWSRNESHQSESFGKLLGADGNGAFTPDALKSFIHSDDVANFEARILGAEAGDGGYDETLMLHNGNKVRMRGARAVDAEGRLERIVVFLDDASAPSNMAEKGDALKMAAASLTGAAATVAKAAADHVQENMVIAASPAVGPAAELVEEKTGTAQAAFEPSAGSVAEAVDNGDIVAAFQPIVCFDTGKVCGAEALVRWPEGEGESRKSMTTEEIVREAQRSGRGAKLASIMMAATVDHVAERVAAGEKTYFGAFNVSLSQVREAGFVDEVKNAIAERKLPKGALVLELTEGERLHETPKIQETFKKLRAAGASLAYDDFGAGFSSLSNLHKYDFDYLKIDKSFIDDIVANGSKKKIVAALARLGKDFGMTVIAEGIESKEAAETAKAIGCRMGQGYHLGAPEVRKEAAAAEAAQTAQAPVAISGAAKAGAEADVIVLDKSLEAAAPTGRPVRRRLFR